MHRHEVFGSHTDASSSTDLLCRRFREGLMHIEVSGTGEGVTSGVRKERIVHPGLLAAPDLLRDASERMSPDRGGSLFSCRPFYGVKPTFREAAPGLIICLICGSIRSRIPPGGRGSRLPGRRETVMGSHRLRRSTVLKEKMLLSIGSQAETRSSIRDDARDCRYTDLAV